ncbi:rod shape-determining protein MreC [Mangrovicoccus algicola]|uniref:Cell shape-determining protein MreC n=1 Tax=Mangrovicoccus algicola TaxID=2771008 RepID=A0A8J6ZAI1_9RHOB|nr:rod shape-determining protein MreC [Mangrovicoccus algicola]MBE3639161.1 rod shape-determining protein MreC [Mangrovicoccus algicola]
MAQDKDGSATYTRPIRRILVGLLVLFLLGIFLFWRIDSPRAERLRMAVIDDLAPRFAFVTAPLTWAGKIAEDFQSYDRLYEQNQQLRRELQQMKAWREAAIQLEQRNAKLLDLNNLRLDPELTYVSGIVLADSGSPFRQSVLINIGAHDRIRDGWAVMDGLGVVGRISGVARNTSRVLLLTDSNSAVPVTIQPSGQKALLQGDNSVAPFIEFLESAELVRPGDRVVTSGAGGVLPPGLLVGQVAQTPDGRLRVRLAADYSRLEVVQVLRTPQREQIGDPGSLVAPDPHIDGLEMQGPHLPDG